jgi:DNA invertase Pin-like site-specific DNA recombinase
MATLTELKSRLNGSAASGEGGGVGKRLKKGEGDKIIYKFLKSLPDGMGKSVQEIINETGMSYSSVFRALNDQKRNKGRYAERDGRWRLTSKLTMI